MLSNKNKQTGSPRAIKNGITINEQQRVKVMDNEICFLSFNVSCSLFKLVKFGIIAMASDPIMVDGMESKGMVIPIAIPSWLRACSLVNPTCTSLKGSKNAINGCIRLVASLTSVIGADDFKIGLKHVFGLCRRPFKEWKIIIPTIVLKTHATLTEIPAGNRSFEKENK